MINRILVVDDTKNIRMMIVKSLSSDEYVVDAVDNGHDAIELFKKSKYDVIILDIRMPQLSGTEVLRIIKDMDRNVSVVIITAFPTVKNAVECIKLGAVDYLRKPFTPEKIKGIITNIMERRKMKPENVKGDKSAVEYAKKCINEGRYDEAIEYLKKSISISIDDPEPFMLLGNIYEINEKIFLADRYYSIALQLAPGSEELINSLNRIRNNRL